MHLGKGAGAPASYTRAPGMRGGSPAAAGVAAAAFSLTPTFTPTFAGASSADLVLVLVQAVEERATARRAAEAAAAARDAAKCALQQQLDQVWPPPPSPTPTFTPTFAGASSPDLVGPVARCGKPCSGLSSGGAGGVRGRRPLLQKVSRVDGTFARPKTALAKVDQVAHARPLFIHCT